MDLGIFKLLDDDEDDHAPAAADVDAFAAVLKGDLGGAGHAAAAAAYGVTRSGNGTAQLLPQSPGASVSAGHSGIRPVPVVPSQLPGQQQLLWNQLTPQQRELYQRRAAQQQRLQQQQQIQQQPHQQNRQSESASGAAGNRKTMLKEGISFTALMPLLQPHLPPEQGQQLSGLYQRFKRNEITREDFIRGARVIAGDTVLVQTIRQMHSKQQAHLQQQQKLQLQQQQQQQQQNQQQPQAQPQSQGQQQLQPSQPPSTQPQQLLPPSASVGTSTPPETSKQQQQQQQQQSQKQTSALQQNLQSQTTQTPLQAQELIVTNAAQQKMPLSHPQASPFQQTQVPSNADHKTLPQGSQSQSHLSSTFSQSQLQSPSVQQGDQQLDPGQGQLLNSKPAAPMLLQPVKHEVDKSLASLQSAKQQSSSSVLPSVQPRPPASVAHQSQAAVVAGAGQPTQPYSQMGLPQQPFPGQGPGHVHLQQPQPQPQPQIGPQASGPVTLTQPQASSAPAPPQALPPPEKPLTKYAKQKLRREQKRREEEERLKKVMEEENLKKLQSVPPGMVTASHHGLHPQHPQLSTSHLPLPLLDLNKQSSSHHPGSLSHQALLQTPISQVDKQQVVPITPVGPAGTTHGQSLIHVKQEPSDLQSEQKRHSFQLPKGSDFLPGQAVQKPAGQAQNSEASTVPPSSTSLVHEQSSNAHQVQMLSPQGSMALTSSSIAPNSAQQVSIASMPAPGVAPIPPIAGTSSLQSTVSAKQVAGHQRMGSISSAAPATSSFNAASPSGSGAQMGQNTQPAASVSATPTVKTPSKKPAVGQKKSAESTPAQQSASKKQKVSAGEPDQSIDQLNDVTAVSGVNLKEEEEQLLIGPKEESRTTEAMRKIVQEEEEKLFLERGPLRAKVAAIATRCGVKSVSDDVGRCLSMSVEERLRSMLYRLIKLSKQRCDVEKERHKVVITSDVRRQILLMKRKAKEMLDKKLAEESERLRKMNEKKEKGSLPDVEREELKAKAQKAQQDEEDRLKANAANVAARAAVGADDMLLKWQMMAAQGRQKRQGGDSGTGEEGAANRGGSSAEGSSAPHSDKKLENGDSAAAGPGNADIDSQGPVNTSVTGRPQGHGPGGAPRTISGRRMLVSKSARGERTITTRDIIAFLETEPQMSKSTLLYRLFERERKSADGKKGQSGNRK